MPPSGRIPTTPRGALSPGASKRRSRSQPTSLSSEADGCRDHRVIPIRTFLNTSTLTRKPTKIRSRPRNSPRKNDQVTPKRFRLLVRPGMNAPTAIRIVAGTREFSLPWRRAATAPAGSRGDDRDSSHQRDGKGDVAGGRSAGIAGGVTEQQREETTEQDGPSHEISKSRFREQKDRSGAQVGRDKECADQIPRAID